MIEITKKSPHILVISQYFHPEEFRINDIATEWVKRGYRVTVLTGIPNYPMGKFFKGYSWFRKRHEVWRGIDIIRIPLTARGHTPVGMIINYFSFVLSGWFWNQFTNIEADIVFSFEVSPMTQVKVGCRYAKKHKVPHYLYIQDLWPENVETVTGIHSKAVIDPINRMVDKIYKQTDWILVTSPSFIEAIVNRKVPVDKRKVHYWPQYAEELYHPVEKRVIPEVCNDDTFKIVFTGNIGKAQGLDILPKAAELLKGKKVKFVIVGDGRYLDELVKEIDERGVGNLFIMIPRQPSEKIPEILSVCDAGFISFTNELLWSMTIPAKLQSYMACGIPIVASAQGETKRVIEDARCGICTDLGDPVALAEGIRHIMNSDIALMGTNARKYYEKNFEKKMLMDRIDLMFDSSLRFKDM